MTPVASALAARIAKDGPLPLPEVMSAVSNAYYAQGDVFGRGGDFVTAPEISQVFGELIGLWCAITWEALGKPAAFHLVECGPGRGTLMADLLRASARVAGFRDAAKIHLVERSAALRARQKAALSGNDVAWHDSLETLPRGPMILLANEFLDALPIRQFVRQERDWAERHVGLEKDAFVFVPIPDPTPPANLPAEAPIGAVAEVCDVAIAFVDALARRIAADGGAALLIDYGYNGPALGETLQAVKQHKYHPVLGDLGDADLTAHVDFGPLVRTAKTAGAQVFGPENQGTFLARLGIGVRTAQLARGKHAAKAAEIAAATRRLTAPDGMGLLLKVMCVAHPSVPLPDGFVHDG